MVLISYAREGTALLLDVLAQIRKVRARVCEQNEDTVVLHGLVGDLQNPNNISFDSTSGPRTIDSRGVIEDWVLEEEEEESDTIDIASINTEPLEVEEEEEADDIENQQDVEDTSDVSISDGNGEALDWDAPEYVPTWLASLPSPLPRQETKISTERYLRRSKRLQQRKRNQQLTAPAPWR
jgi:hypothetical protein